MRQTIAIKGAREHNLKNISLEIPRDQLIVFTGLSGSGKSSLAFDTIYAEGQRLLLESLASFPKHFIPQLKKPAVDTILGLSPVVSIEQKNISHNPRSTVGTMTDIYDYLRILFATSGIAHCPYCSRTIPIKSPHQIVEHLLSQPVGTPIEVSAPIFKIYGEDYDYLFTEIRTNGYRYIRINGEQFDISEGIELEEGQEYSMQVVIDKVVVRKDLEKQVLTSINNGLRIGEGLLSFRFLNEDQHVMNHFDTDFACPEHHTTMGELQSYYFSFNEAGSACVTCQGLGTYAQVHPDLLVPDKSRSIARGAFIPDAFTYDKNSWLSRLIYSVSQHYNFSLDTPFQELSPEIVDILFYGTKGEKILMMQPEGGIRGERNVGRLFRFDGIINTIERRYRQLRKQRVTSTEMENYLHHIMVEYDCPDCHGKLLKRQRFLVTLNDNIDATGKNIHELGTMSLADLHEFLSHSLNLQRQREAGLQILSELKTRLQLLLAIGLDYLHLNRRAMTLSGGESQRLRLSTQISSGLMGMLYVLDEPSIGLHAKDNLKMIATLKQLRDIGNTVIVVEHDEDTMRAADHIIELGPGPGVHGGEIVAQGTIDDILQHPTSLTGQFLSGRQRIPLPIQRRQPDGRILAIRGASENNLKHIDVEIPIGLFVCITGVSGSGKSSLINGILYKKLMSVFHDSRILSGAHETIEGIEHIHDIVNIDQSPIGRTPTSNPATYIGIYDDIRHLFAATAEAHARDYTASHFSFNVKGGRCEACSGQGMVTTHLHFMPDVEVVCQVCKGARYTQELLEVKYHGKNIAEILDLTIEEAVEFFADRSLIARKLDMLRQLGLGYLKLGQSSKTISGGEAQRVRLAYELGKVKRNGRTLYLLDEPTTGLHLADIQRLLDSLNRLVDAGNTVLIIEHHLDVIKTADYIVDLGPEGGANGGHVLCTGTPEEIIQHTESYTGQFLKRVLENSIRNTTSVMAY